MMRKTCLALLCAIAAPVIAAAQSPQDVAMAADAFRRAQAGQGEDPLARLLFPPELIMSNQRAIGLQDPQREEILGAVRTSQAVFAELQMRMAGEMERLIELLRAPSVDPAAVLTQLDRVLMHEHQIKRQHVGMLVRIRNALTSEQRSRLEAIRSGQPGTAPPRRDP